MEKLLTPAQHWELVELQHIVCVVYILLSCLFVDICDLQLHFGTRGLVRTEAWLQKYCCKLSTPGPQDFILDKNM
eukprot:3031076-Amphidinium_carterae.1